MGNVSEVTQKPKLAIYGLSANPPTGLGGHQGIVRYLANSGKFQEIWILPVYKHVLKDTVGTNFFHRLAMCELCFRDETVPNSCEVLISEMEKEVKSLHPPEERVGTFHILTYLRRLEQYRDYDVSLILGLDTFKDLAMGKWIEFDKIPLLAELYVFPRTGSIVFSSVEDLIKYSRFIQLHHLSIVFDDFTLPGTVSSSWIREIKPWLIDGFSDSDIINPKVIDYIRSNKHELYI
jgi:nicotinic acid mononucleotide adenylyltransferase